MFAAHYEKSFVPAFFKVSIDHLFDIRESGIALRSDLWALLLCLLSVYFSIHIQEK